MRANTMVVDIDRIDTHPAVTGLASRMCEAQRQLDAVGSEMTLYDVGESFATKWLATKAGTVHLSAVLAAAAAVGGVASHLTGADTAHNTAGGVLLVACGLLAFASHEVQMARLVEYANGTTTYP